MHLNKLLFKTIQIFFLITTFLSLNLCINQNENELSYRINPLDKNNLLIKYFSQKSKDKYQQQQKNHRDKVKFIIRNFLTSQSNKHIIGKRIRVLFK